MLRITQLIELNNIVGSLREDWV